MKIFSYFRQNNYRIFGLVSFILCCFYTIVFEPITWQAQGDSPAYIEMAKQFLGTSNEYGDFTHRQPIYSLLIAPFIFLFGETFFIYPVMWFQYFLIFLSSLIIYRVFESLEFHKAIPFIAGILYLLNFSTIFYGYNILSETLALFIFVSITYTLMLFSRKYSIRLIIILGILSGLMVLTRFNAMGLPFFIIIDLGVIHFHAFKWSRAKEFIFSILVYVFSLSFILNLWMIYNYYEHGFYGLIQKQNPRLALVIYARIDENIKVSPENQIILDIFLTTRQNLINNENTKEIEYKKGSLLNYAILNKVYFYLKGGEEQINSWQLYNEAKPLLLEYFGLDGNNPQSVTKLSELLEPFNKEIKLQTKSDGMRQRVSAVLLTLRHTGGTLPVAEPINLNKLPSFVHSFYRLSFMLGMFFTFIISIILFFKNIWKLSDYKNYLLLVLILLIIYFPISHFLAITPGDANRFKFPAEPIVLGLFVFYMYAIIFKIREYISHIVKP